MYVGTDGHIHFDNPWSYASLYSGKALAIYITDLVQSWPSLGVADPVGIKYWSDASNFVLQWRGYGFTNPQTTTVVSLEYQVKFNTANSYADVSILRKGTSLPQPAFTPGMYLDGLQWIPGTNGVPTPFTVPNDETVDYADTANAYTYRLNFDGTQGSVTITPWPTRPTGKQMRIPDTIMKPIAAITSGSLNSGYTTITTAANQYVPPILTSSTPTLTSSSISVPFITGGADYSTYSYYLRTGSHTGTLIASGTGQTSNPLVINTGLTASTQYYLTMIPANSMGQNGASDLSTPLTPAPAPVISNVQLTDSTVTPTAPTIGTFSSSATNVGTVNWTNGTNTTSAWLQTVTGSGSKTGGTDGGTLATSGTFTITSSGTADVTVGVKNSTRAATLSWTQSGSSSYSVDWTYNGVAQTAISNSNSTASTVSITLPGVSTGSAINITKIWLWPSTSYGGTATTWTTGASLTPAVKTNTGTGSGTVAFTTQATAPTITGSTITPATGTAGTNTYTANVGTVTGSPAPTYTYQWQYFSNSSFAYVNVTGATSSTYAPPANFNTLYPNLGFYCLITATNTAGSATDRPTATLNSPAATAPGTPVVTGDNGLGFGGTFSWSCTGNPTPTYRVTIGYNATVSNGTFSTLYQYPTAALTTSNGVTGTSIQPGYAPGGTSGWTSDGVTGHTSPMWKGAGYYRCTIQAINSAGNSSGSFTQYMT